jgi:hypothetical protein
MMPARGEAVAEAVTLSEPDAAFQRAGVHPRATSVAPAPETASPDTAPEGDESASPPPGVVLGKRLAGAAAGHASAVRSGALVKGRMPSMAEARDRHATAAGHYNAAAATWARHAWGYFHLLVKAVLNGIEWVTETPPRLFLAVAFIVVAWLWI